MRILSVDDDEKNLYLIESIFKNTNCIVISARNGAEALDALEKEPFDIIISDILMPEVDGWQLCYEVKNSERWKNIPFIFYTATYTGEKDEEFSMSLGASRFIIKPAEPEIFINIINSIVEESKGVFSIPKLEITDELRFIKAHNDRLVNKLNQKVTQLQKLNENLQNAIDEKNREIAERKQAEDALYKSERLFRNVFQYHAAVKLIIDPATGNIIDANEAAVKYYGWPREQVTRMKIYDINTLSPEEVKMEMEKARTQNRIHFEFRHRRADGSVRDVEVFSSNIKVQGKDLLHSIIFDITERKIMEAALRENEQKYRELFERMSSGVAVYEAVDNGDDFLIKDFNSAGEKIERLSRKDIIGKLVTEAFPGVKDFGLFNIFQKVWKTGESEFFSAGVYKDNRTLGSWRENWVYKLPTGEIVAVYNDITKRKEAEEKLKESEAKLARAQRIAKLGSWEWNVRNASLIWSDEIYSIFGFSRDTILTYNGIVEKIHPEDRGKNQDFVDRLLNSAVSSAEIEFRIVAPESEIKHVHQYAEVTRDETGTVQTILGTMQDISALIQIEQALSAAQQVAQIGSWEYDVTSNTITWSAQMFRIFDRDPALGAMLWKEHRGLIHPDDWDDLNNQMKHTVKYAVPFNAEFRIVTGNKKTRWAWGKCEVIQDSKGVVRRLYGIIQDITERKITEEALKKSEERLKNAQEMAHLGGWELDIAGNKLTWSDEVYRIFGVQLQEFEASYEAFLDAVHPDDREAVDKAYSDSIKNGKDNYEIKHRIIRKNTGEIRHIYEKCEHIKNKNGKIIRSIGMILDITESKLAEVELKKYRDHLEEQVKTRTTELEKAKEEAMSANRAKSIFLSSMSHEIRTPLNAIIGFSQLLLHDKSLSLHQKEHMNIIIRSGEHLLELINDVLELSRIEAGRILFKRDIFNLRALLKDIENMFRVRTDAKGLELSMNISKDIPEFVATDEGKLRQILINLMGNAVKFTEKGSVTINIHMERIENAKSNLIFQVKDTGPGIPENELSSLFKAFGQTEAGAKFGGTGLGLNISRQYVLLLGGDISVKSKPGEGACFTVKINVEEVKDHNTIEPLSNKKVITLQAEQEEYRVLAVDDDDNNRKLLKELLEMIGFTVKQASNGLEAIEVFKEWSPHIILMDIRMPVMNGLEAILRIKEIDIENKTKIVAVTASAFDEDRQKALDWGADAYLRKPFKEHDLFECLQTQLGVKYVYDNENEIAPAEEPILTSQSLMDIPDDIIDKMMKACINLDYDHLRELIESVGNQLPQTGENLNKLLKAYQYDILIKILKERMEPR